MKRHRVTFEIQIDVPSSVPADQAWSKYVEISGGQHVNIGTPKVISDEPLGDELLPYEIRRNEQLIVRKMIADVLAKNDLPFVVSIGTHWDGRPRNRADHPMELTITMNSKAYTAWKAAIEDEDPLDYSTSISLQIIDGEILTWNYQKHKDTKIGAIGDPDLKGLISFICSTFRNELKAIKGKL